MKHLNAFQPRLGLAVLGAGVMFASQVGSVAAVVHPSSYIQKAATVTVASGASGTATATCPSGDLVVTGGAYWHPTNSSTSSPTINTSVSSSSPQTNLSGWYATGVNQSTQSMQMTVTADCLPKSALGKYTVLKREVLVDPNRPGNADLACKSGQLVIAGGGVWHKPGSNPKPGLAAHLTTSDPDLNATGWSVAGTNTGSTVLDLRVVAVCVPSSMLFGAYTGRAVNSAVSYGGVSERYQACPSNTLAVAGGVEWTRGGTTPDTDVQNAIESSSVTGDGAEWYAAVRFSDSRLSGDNEFYEVTVYCLSEG